MDQKIEQTTPDIDALKIQKIFAIFASLIFTGLIAITYFNTNKLSKDVTNKSEIYTKKEIEKHNNQTSQENTTETPIINHTLKTTESILNKNHDINSLEFSFLSEEEQEYLKSLAIYQYTFSSAFIFLFLIFAYNVHIFFLLQNFIETLNIHRKLAGNREIGAHSWYLLIVIIGFPLALAVIPEFSTTSYTYKPELLSKIVLATLSNLIVIMITAELSTIYFSLDQDTRIKTKEDLMKKIFKDLRLKQLLVAIIMDIITFYFISRLPSLKQNLNFQNILIMLLICLAGTSLISSFGAMFTLLTNEKMQKFNLQNFD